MADTTLSRDLQSAKSAYKAQDAAKSALAHGAEGDALVPANTEKHSKSAGQIKSIVYGGMDGIITTFAVVAGAAGGGLGPNVIMVMGFSSLIADALSMGVGDALSSKAEMEVAKREREREAWEFDSFPEGEIQEMVEIYEGRGMSKEDAEIVMKTCAKYKDLFVDMMLVDELGLDPPGEATPWRDGAVTFSAFCFFGFFPLAAYCIFGLTTEMNTKELFGLACALTCIMLFVLGSLKSLVTSRPWWSSGLETLVMGSAVAFVAFAIGWIIEDGLITSGASMGGLH